MQSGKTLFKGVYQETLSKIVLLSAGFILNIMLARKSGPEEFGYIGTFTSLLFVYELFVTNGIRQGVSKILSSQEANLHQLWKSSAFLQLLLTTCLTIMGLLFKSLIVEALAIQKYEFYYYMIYLILPIEGLFYVNMGFLHGTFDFYRHSLANALYSLIRVGVAIAILIITENGILAVLVGTLFGYSIAYITSYKKKSNSGPEIKLSVIIGYSTSFLFFYLLVSIFINLDVLLLNILGTSKESIGLYKAATSIGLALYFLIASVNQVTFPLITNLYSQKKLKEMASLFNKVMLFLLFFSLFSFVLFTCFSDFFVSILFGNDFLGGYSVLPIYGISICLLSIVIYIGNTNLAMKKGGTIHWIMLIGLLAYIALVAILYQPLGLFAPPLALIIVAFTCSIVLLLRVNQIAQCEVINFKRLITSTIPLIGITVLVTVTFLLLKYRLPSVLSGVIAVVSFVLLGFILVKDVRNSLKYLYRLVGEKNAKDNID